MKSTDDTIERKGARRDELKSVGVEARPEARVQHASVAHGHAIAGVTDSPCLEVRK